MRKEKDFFKEVALFILYLFFFINYTSSSWSVSTAVLVALLISRGTQMNEKKNMTYQFLISNIHIELEAGFGCEHFDWLDRRWKDWFSNKIASPCHLTLFSNWCIIYRVPCCIFVMISPVSKAVMHVTLSKFLNFKARFSEILLENYPASPLSFFLNLCK